MEARVSSLINQPDVQIDDIRRGVAEANAGEFADDAEIEAIFKAFAATDCEGSPPAAKIAAPS